MEPVSRSAPPGTPLTERSAPQTPARQGSAADLRWVRFYDDSTGHYYFAKVRWDMPEDGWVDHKDVPNEDNLILRSHNASSHNNLIQPPKERSPAVQPRPREDAKVDVARTALLLFMVCVIVMVFGLVLYNTVYLREIEQEIERRYREDDIPKAPATWASVVHQKSRENPPNPPPNTKPNPPKPSHDPSGGGGAGQGLESRLMSMFRNLRPRRILEDVREKWNKHSPRVRALAVGCGTMTLGAATGTVIGLSFREPKGRGGGKMSSDDPTNEDSELWRDAFDAATQRRDMVDIERESRELPTPLESSQVEVLDCATGESYKQRFRKGSMVD